MNGLTDAKGRKVFDSNFVINSFHRLQTADTFRAEFAGSECFISVITEMELLSFHAISPVEEAAIRAFLDEVTVIPLNDDVKQKTIAFRRATNCKLPDSIIATAALLLDAEMVTEDGKLLNVAFPGFRVISL